MKLLVINPNMTQAVTDAVAAAARRTASPGTEITAVTGTFGPQVITSRAENAIASHGVMELAAKHGPGHDAIVLGVSLDTALWALRELFAMPVVGMTEAGVHAACLVATRFAVLTYGRHMIASYTDQVAGYGLAGRCVRVDAIDFPPEASFNARTQVLDAIIALATRAIERDGAEAIVLGGAAMAGFRDELQPRCPVPLIDCMAAAVPLAEMLVKLKLPKPTAGSLRVPGPRKLSGVGPELTALFSNPSSAP